jgi:DNA-binding transcriptional regulator YiaG
MHVRFETVARWERGVYRPSPLAVATLRRVLLVPEVAQKLTDELRRSAGLESGE